MVRRSQIWNYGLCKPQNKVVDFFKFWGPSQNIKTVSSMTIVHGNQKIRSKFLNTKLQLLRNICFFLHMRFFTRFFQRHESFFIPTLHAGWGHLNCFYVGARRGKNFLRSFSCRPPKKANSLRIEESKY